ncbi:hypothetical protein JCM19232_516 [Vibrio ishigakensis]|uniref:Uncharacterized protein n=1 Tax=Vibrio ishigakensis TaxID=1481914 RepID=A0A0B8PAH0_9VIBR|nr:hypothetical protein JCM19232_516 [Vibrio ishigakensis]
MLIGQLFDYLIQEATIVSKGHRTCHVHNSIVPGWDHPMINRL